MKVSLTLLVHAAIGIGLMYATHVRAQGPADANSSASAAQSPDYPGSPPGVLIQNSDWRLINGEYPSKSHVKNGLADSVSYGAVAAKIVSDYDGEHASVQVQATQPWICICHIISLPGAPAIVVLHPKKNVRELDGGNLRILQSKMAQAEKSDLVPAEVTQAEANVWLVRPQQPLAPGEYALILGTQNVNIFPFTVLGPPADPPTADAVKQQ